MSLIRKKIKVIIAIITGIILLSYCIFNPYTFIIPKSGDFKVSDSNKNDVFTFKIRNFSFKSVEIHNTESNCNCTNIDFANKHIAPFMQTEVTVTTIL